MRQLMATERPSGAALSVTVAATGLEPAGSLPPIASQWTMICWAVFVILAPLERRVPSSTGALGSWPG